MALRAILAYSALDRPAAVPEAAERALETVSAVSPNTAVRRTRPRRRRRCCPVVRVAVADPSGDSELTRAPAGWPRRAVRGGRAAGPARRAALENRL